MVDTGNSVASTVAAVEDLFAEALAEGPCAETLSERQALLREANGSIVSQVRGYHRRPWAHGDVEAVLREFACECGDPACEANVRVSVGLASVDPVLAPGHR